MLKSVFIAQQDKLNLDLVFTKVVKTTSKKSYYWTKYLPILERTAVWAGRAQQPGLGLVPPLPCRGDIRRQYCPSQHWIHDALIFPHSAALPRIVDRISSWGRRRCGPTDPSTACGCSACRTQSLTYLGADNTGDWGWLWSTPVTTLRCNIIDTDPIQAQAYTETLPLLGSIISGHNPYQIDNAQW